MAKKGNRIQVILECTEHKESGMAGTSRYITTKNKKNTPERLEIKKIQSYLEADDRSQGDKIEIPYYKFPTLLKRVQHRYRNYIKTFTHGKEDRCKFTDKFKRLTKAIKMIKSPKSGAYTFVESVMGPEAVNEWLSKK